MVHNQPYDESLDVSDGEEIASATVTPREMERGTPGMLDIFTLVRILTYCILVVGIISTRSFLYSNL